jgi:hypothetical protein
MPAYGIQLTVLNLTLFAMNPALSRSNAVNNKGSACADKSGKCPACSDHLMRGMPYYNMLY